MVELRNVITGEEIEVRIHGTVLVNENEQFQSVTGSTTTGVYGTWNDINGWTDQSEKSPGLWQKLVNLLR